MLCLGTPCKPVRPRVPGTGPVGTPLMPCSKTAGRLGAPLLLGAQRVTMPTLVDLFRGYWMSDDSAHGPIVAGHRYGCCGASGPS